MIRSAHIELPAALGGIEEEDPACPADRRVP